MTYGGGGDGDVIIKKIGDYIKEIKRLRIIDNQGQEFFQWYRGHGDKAWELLPKVQRDFCGDDEELFRKERYFSNDFQARASLFKSSKPQLSEYANWLTILDKGIIIKQLKIQGQPTQKRRHWRQRAAFLRGG